MWWRELGKRIAVLVVIVAVVLAVAGIAPTVLQDDETEQQLETPEYDPAVVAADPVEATGTVAPDPDPDADAEGTVLIDRGHGNRFARSDIEVLVDALASQGYDIEFYTGGDLATHLEDVDAFLVIDPGSEYQPGDIDDIRQFTGDGGRLVMVGEPDRSEVVSSGFFGASLQLQESRLTTLASSYGMSVDTQYLYNQEHADGTFKNILAQPADGADLAEVERTALYTAAAVSVRDGSVVLRSAPNTHKSGSDEVTGEYPVVVRKDGVLLLGDKSFMRGDRYRVADNERLIAYLVEFMIEGDHRPSNTDEDGTEADGPGTVTTAEPTPTATASSGG